MHYFHDSRQKSLLLRGLNIKQDQRYDENLAFEIVDRIWGRKIANKFEFCNMKISFNGNGKNQEKKTIVIIKIILPENCFEFLNSINRDKLVLLDKSMIDKIFEGKDENGKRVRVDETHKSFIQTYFDL